MSSDRRRGFPHTTPPRGWFQLGWSDDFPAGSALPLRRFGRDLVAFRGGSGDLRVFDAHCPHFGAHLGHGGCVEGDDIVCPFHGWRFGPDGAVVDVPYSERKRPANRLRPWHLTERDGVVLIWHDVDGGEPQWDPPSMLSGLGTPVFAPDRIHEDVRMYPQMMVENSIDVAHFKSVHRARVAPRVTSIKVEGPLLRNVVEWPDGGRLVNDLHGVGLAWSVFEGLFPGMKGAVTFTAVTPIDDEMATFFVTNWVMRGDDDGADLPPAGQRFYSAQRTQVAPDRVIWENMIWRERPATTPEETHLFRQLREWATQFYEPLPAAVNQTEATR